MQLDILASFVAIALSMGLVQAAVTNNTAATDAPATTGDVSAKAISPHPLTGAAITCTDFQIVPNTADIRALCQDNGGVLRSTQISLGNCMGNQDGNLGCQSG
jgi:hypothetical protein